MDPTTSGKLKELRDIEKWSLRSVGFSVRVTLVTIAWDMLVLSGQVKFYTEPCRKEMLHIV